MSEYTICTILVYSTTIVDYKSSNSKEARSHRRGRADAPRHRSSSRTEGLSPHRRPRVDSARLGFFNPHLPAEYGLGDSILSATKIFYRSVHMFIDAIDDYAMQVEPREIRLGLPS